MPGYNFADGQPVDVWDCNNGVNQNWDFTAGTVRTQNNKCLDVTGNSTANDTPIEIWNCNGGANQQFVLSAAGDLVNPKPTNASTSPATATPTAPPSPSGTATAAPTRSGTAADPPAAIPDRSETFR
ncbi:ricin-type beta-trefoil lectin domain protein [Micromonospora sp. M12]